MLDFGEAIRLLACLAAFGIVLGVGLLLALLLAWCGFVPSFYLTIAAIGFIVAAGLAIYLWVTM